MGASYETRSAQATTPTVRIFLCGDVMTGRGIDQMLPHPCDPQLHEDYATSALHYVRLAERAAGPIPRNVAPSYVWGAALDDSTVHGLTFASSISRRVSPAAKTTRRRASITE